MIKWRFELNVWSIAYIAYSVAAAMTRPLDPFTGICNNVHNVHKLFI